MAEAEKLKEASKGYRLKYKRLLRSVDGMASNSLSTLLAVFLFQAATFRSC